MFKVKVIKKFNLIDYDKVKVIKKTTGSKKNEFNVGDMFECDEEMLNYLQGGNAQNLKVVKIIEDKTTTIEQENNKNKKVKSKK